MEYIRNPVGKQRPFWGHNLATLKTGAAYKKPEVAKYIHHFRSAVYKMPRRGRVCDLTVLWRNGYCAGRVINKINILWTLQPQARFI